MKFNPRIGISDIVAVCRALFQKQLSGRTPIVKEFEEAFAHYNNVRYAASVNSGSSALFLAIKALGLPQGTKIICPAFGYVAVPNAIVQAGHIPVFVDVEVHTGNINPDLIRVGDEKAIVCIDTYGHPCDYVRIKSFGLPVIQDAAEAIGAEYKGQKISGDIATFSFFANKTITTGEGGMVVSNNRELIERVKKLRDQSGTDVRYWHDDFGFSLCMGSLQAALGLSQLDKIEKILEQKRKNVQKLRHLSNWMVVEPYAKHGYWAFGFLTDNKEERLAQDKNLRPFFYPYNHLPMYKDGKHYPVAEYLSEFGVYYLT